MLAILAISPLVGASETCDPAGPGLCVIDGDPEIFSCGPGRQTDVSATGIVFPAAGLFVGGYSVSCPDRPRPFTEHGVSAVVNPCVDGVSCASVLASLSQSDYVGQPSSCVVWVEAGVGAYDLNHQAHSELPPGLCPPNPGWGALLP